MREKENCVFFIYPTLAKFYHTKLRYIVKGKVKKIENPHLIVSEKKEIKWQNRSVQARRKFSQALEFIIISLIF